MKWWSNLIEITNYIFCRRKGLKEEKKFEWDRENNNKFFLAKKRRHDKDLQNYKKAKVDLGELNTTLIKAPSKQIVEFIDNLNKISTSYSINKISQTVEEEREEPNLTEGISLKEENFNVKNPSVITKLDFSNERIIYNKSSHKSLMHYVEESDLEVNFKILQGCIFDKTRRNNFPIIDFINYQKLQEIIKGTNKEFTPKEINLQYSSLLKLKEGQWLNDEIVNSYGKLIMKRQSEGESSYPMTYVFSTFFYEKLKNLLLQNESNVYTIMKRFWEKKKSPKINFFNYENILIPINHTNFHWSLVYLNINKRTLSYYDSMTMNLNQAYSIMDDLALIFKEYLQENGDKDNNKKLSTSFASSDINMLLENQPSSSDSASDSSNKRPSLNFIKKILEVPRQGNSSDCGVFLCKFMDYISRGEEFDFDQADMSYFRVLTGIELINERLFTY